MNSKMKRHKIKKEKSECSSSQARDHEEHDLAYYIHDRVELMHQVFSILKYKELKTMAPECVRNLAIGDLQELCTEELLGISSKRLLAILDGADPPSDTESSSPSPPPDELETISLDSISSDEELLNTSHKKKKKHKHHSRRNSKKKDKPNEPEVDENAELSKASRAGLTVLELLELQARARAIRAQLQQEQIHKNLVETTTVDSSHHSSDNEVEIKEEPPDVVEISSEDEKPDINQLKNKIVVPSPTSKVTNTEQINKSVEEDHSQTVTKRINDLIITVPQTKSSRKIKLNRNKVLVSVPNDNKAIPIFSNVNTTNTTAIVEETVSKKEVENPKTPPEKSKDGKTKKNKKDKKKKTVEKEGSDHDEITLQLSDSEKMDLLDDLDESRKNYDKVSSSSVDSESSSSDSDDISSENTSKISSLDIDPTSLKATEKNITEKSDTYMDTIPLINTCNDTENIYAAEQTNTVPITTEFVKISDTSKEDINSESVTQNTVDQNYKPTKQPDTNSLQNNSDLDKNSMVSNDNTTSDVIQELNTINENIHMPERQNTDSVNIYTTTDILSEQNTISEEISIDYSISETGSVAAAEKCSEHGINPSNIVLKSTKEDEKIIGVTTLKDVSVIDNNLCDKKNSDESLKDKNKEQPEATQKSLSDGEISDRESSEVEAMDVQPVVVCISDEDSPKKKDAKKKKKKEKKSKKSKKSKSDFLKGPNQNFYIDGNQVLEQDLNKGNVFTSFSNENLSKCSEIPELIDLDSDEVCEIFELSDDSSCSEIEENLLSKEPTAEEIEALSAKIDEIKREEVVTDKQIQAHEKMLAEKEKNKQGDGNIVNVSWRDRYLDSNKVKKVLTTANIFNALRKKNKELKKKIENSKKKHEIKVVEKNSPIKINVVQLEEGSIEQYNTLEGLTKYVDPVKEPITERSIKDNENATKEMRKDAKQLLKMYRRLLKYNDIKKQTDSKKKKKKKKETHENSDHNAAKALLS